MMACGRLYLRSALLGFMCLLFCLSVLLFCALDGRLSSGSRKMFCSPGSSNCSPSVRPLLFHRPLVLRLGLRSLPLHGLVRPYRGSHEWDRLPVHGRRARFSFTSSPPRFVEVNRMNFLLLLPVSSYLCLFRPPTLIVLSPCLLRAGDVELNPGPRSTDICARCSRVVRANQMGIFCDCCHLWFHAKCINMTREELNNKAASADIWICSGCLASALPYQCASSPPTSPVLSVPYSCAPLIFPGSSLPASAPPLLAASRRGVVNSVAERNLSFLTINARSILPKVDELDCAVSSLPSPPDVLFLNETWLDDNIGSSELRQTHRYETYRLDRNRHGGGVALLINRAFRSTVVGSLLSPALEGIAASVSLGRSNILLISVYRPPGQPNGFPELLTWLSPIFSLSKFSHIFLSGDLNVDLLDPGHHLGPSFWDFSDALLLSQLVNEPTRITASSSSLLDVFLTNSPELVASVWVIPPLAGSDHCMVNSIVSLFPSSSPPVPRRFWDYGNADWLEASRLLSSLPSSFWPVANPDEAWAMFATFLSEVVDKCIPSKMVTVRPRIAPWLGRNVRLAIAHRDRLFSLAKRKHSPAAWNNYKSARNRTANSIKFSKRAYFSKLFLIGKRNPKKLWSLVSAFGKIKASLPSVLKTSSGVFNTPSSIAEAFSRFFASCFNKASPVLFSFARYSPTSVLSSLHCSETRVLFHLNKLGNHTATGPDNISAIMLKNLAIPLAPHLSAIFNCSLSAGRFPIDWKIAHVVPIFKKGDKSLIKNYRPISILSLVSKLFERIVLEQLTAHLDANNILSDCQFGFRRRSSTLDALLKFDSDRISSLEAGNDFISLFVDLEKAFDSVPHYPLLVKLANMGICDSALSWFKSYLSDRSQCIRVGGSLSNPVPVVSGVPQGSILGPVLFILYLNDLSLLKLNAKSHLILYADDITLTHSLCAKASIATFQRDLDLIFKWLNSNFLSPNYSKTEFMFFSNRRGPYLRDDVSLKAGPTSIPIPRCSSFRLLGVILTDDGKWSAHTADVACRARRTWGFFNRTFKNSSPDFLRLLYIQVVLPLLDYAAPLWSPVSRRDSLCLDKVQLLAGRSILGSWSADLPEIQSRLSLGSLSSRRDCLSVKFVHRILTARCMTPNPFDSKRHDPRTRSSAFNVFPCFFRLAASANSFFGRAPALWNSLPDTVKGVRGVHSFKVLAAKHFS